MHYTQAGAKRTPLCPAGHLPLEGGDWLSLPLSPIAKADRWPPSHELLISPLGGEMSGRTERGAWALTLVGMNL
ncbi:hypothetical protein FJ471_33885, partial [Mesorhizobium sp. B2-7-1]